MGNCFNICSKSIDIGEYKFLHESKKLILNNHKDVNELISLSHQKIKTKMQRNKNEKEEDFYLINKNTSTNDNIDLTINFNTSNGIKYPIDFKIISKSMSGINNPETNNSYLIATIKDYIIIKDNKDKKIFYVCSLLDEDYFNVDFIFVFDKESNNCYNQIYGTLYSSDFRVPTKNKKVDFFGASNKLGFYICLLNKLPNNLNSNNFNNFTFNLNKKRDKIIMR